MLYDEIEDPGSLTPDELRERYVAELAAAVRAVGAERVAERAGVDDAVVDAVVDGGGNDVRLDEAAAILAAGDESHTRDEILLEVRDHLLLQMTTAVLDVDTVAADVDADLTAKEIQQKIEGRTSMTLAEYAMLHQYIASKADAW